MFFGVNFGDITNTTKGIFGRDSLCRYYQLAHYDPVVVFCIREELLQYVLCSIHIISNIFLSSHNKAKNQSC